MDGVVRLACEAKTCWHDGIAVPDDFVLNVVGEVREGSWFCAGQYLSSWLRQLLAFKV